MSLYTILLTVIAITLVVIAWRLIAGEQKFESTWAEINSRLPKSSVTRVCYSVAISWLLYLLFNTKLHSYGLQTIAPIFGMEASNFIEYFIVAILPIVTLATVGIRAEKKHDDR